jgi:hypothetical protein
MNIALSTRRVTQAPLGSPHDHPCSTEDRLTRALTALYRERLAKLCADPEARSWGGRAFEAALAVFDEDATRDEIEALLRLARQR